jgi:beta-galactosidase
MNHSAPRVHWLVLSILLLITPMAFARERLSLDSNWKFHLNNPDGVGSNTALFEYPEVHDLAKASKDDTEKDAELAKHRIDAVKTNLGGDLPVVKADYDDSKWEPVSLPHDWVVALPFANPPDVPKWLHEVIDSHGYKDIRPGHNDVGWYRRSFDLPASDKGKSLSIQFDGVYRNSVVWLNGHCLGRNTSGYSGFEYDISSVANYGAKNELVVRCDASRVEGWFYEGAGIYRHVWLTKSPAVHVKAGTLSVLPRFDANGSCMVRVAAVVRNDSPNEVTLTARSKATGPDGASFGLDALPEQRLMVENVTKLTVPSGGEREVEHWIGIDHAKHWSLENPQLYSLRFDLAGDGNKAVDECTESFGIRETKFDPKQGLFLNGKHVEIRGTCNHQDAAGVGSAIPDSLNFWRLEQLKKFGCNAIRTSHNPPTPELLDACDRLGILVMDETRKSGDYPTTIDEMRRLVIRDRNHPSVILWSIGNEENGIQGDDNVGVRVATAMKKAIEELDTTRPITAAMNGGWGRGFSHVIDVQGFNYGGNLTKYHKDHPNQPMMGSENGSTVSTRGIYENDPVKGYVSAYDVNAPSWATTAEKWVNDYRAKPYMAGGFVWTGFDYRGEPTPYGWPCINSHFGVLDTCGFFKDEAFYYQSVWTDAPMVHLLPHWNWTPGKVVDVWAYSNGDEVELLLNGKSLGRQKYPAGYHVSWKVPWEPGKLTAVAFKDGKQVATDTVETAGPPAKVVLSCDRTGLDFDGVDTACAAVQITDAAGRPVPTASNLVRFKIDGGAKILGVGNGDPSCHEPDKADQRSAFNGKCMVIVQAPLVTGTIGGKIAPVMVTATADGLEPGTLRLTMAGSGQRPSVP